MTDTKAPERSARGGVDPTQVDGPYARYVLGILVVIYMFNFIDRQILSILANDIKADLGITDAQIGFLYGTAFAVFYAIFGIPFGRLSDVWVRTRIVSIGLGFWSLMTALSGTARSFGSLAVFRFGVGVGEASASPAAISLIADWFRPERRATAMAIYASGIYIGGGVAYLVGGPVLDGWNTRYPDPALAPLGMRGWQVAFLAVGVPGLAMSLWAWTLKEPWRGMSEGVTAPPPAHPSPFRAAFDELLSLLPGISLFRLSAAGAGLRVLGWNLLALAIIAGAAWGMNRLLGNPVQWASLGLGMYCAFCWAQSLALKQPEVFTTLFHNRALLLAVVGFPLLSLVAYGTGFWMVPYVLRSHAVSATEVGLVMGSSAVVAGLIGVTLGGWLADRLRERHVAGRLYVGVISALGALPTGLLMLWMDSILGVYAVYFLYLVFKVAYNGPAYASVNDLVPPRMRGTVTALYLLMTTFIGLAIGPYLIGAISTRLSAGGADPAEALRTGILVPLFILPVAAGLLLLAARELKRRSTTPLALGAGNGTIETSRT